MNNLKDIEKNENQLYEYIVDLAKYGEESESIKITKIEKYINHPSSEIRSAVFFALLFVLKIDKEEYKNQAIKYLLNKHEDEDLRVKCSSGLAQTYKGTKNKELLSIFNKIFHDNSEEIYIKSSVFDSLLLVFGLKTRDIFMRRGGYKQYVDEDDLIEFNEEIKNIESIVN